MRSALGLAGLWPGRRRTSLGCQRQLMAPTAPPSRCALTHLNEKAPTSGAFHEVGGTGLEPVTPSLSSRSGRSPQFAEVRPGRIVERNAPGERTLGAPERTSSVAIVATALAPGRSSRVRGAKDSHAQVWRAVFESGGRRFDSSRGHPGCSCGIVFVLRVAWSFTDST